MLFVSLQSSEKFLLLQSSLGFILPSLRGCARAGRGCPLGLGECCPQVVSNHGKIVLERRSLYGVAAANVWILLVPYVSRGKWTSLEGVQSVSPPWILCLSECLGELLCSPEQSHSSCFCCEFAQLHRDVCGEGFSGGGTEVSEGQGLSWTYIADSQQWYGCVVWDPEVPVWQMLYFFSFYRWTYRWVPCHHCCLFAGGPVVLQLWWQHWKCCVCLCSLVDTVFEFSEAPQ